MTLLDYLQYADGAIAVSVLVFVVFGFYTGKIVSRKTLDSVLAMVERLLKEKL